MPGRLSDEGRDRLPLGPWNARLVVCSRTTRLDWSPRPPLPRPAPSLTHDTVVVREWHERGAGESEGGRLHCHGVKVQGQTCGCTTPR